MNGNFELLIPILLPILAGSILVPLKKWNKTRRLGGISVAVIALSAVAIIWGNLSGEKGLFLWNLTDSIPIMLKLDDIGRLFSTLTAGIWLLIAFFSWEYLKHEERQSQFWGFYLITFGVITGLDYSGNLMTMYLFYELMTMVTVTLVLHNRTKEAVSASLKYLIYSLFGAFMGLLSIFFVHKYGDSLEFTPGGVFGSLGSEKDMLLVVAFLVILGFSTKAGMFPLHGWLPTAHPVAPAPASAALSGIITKSGILALVRVIYYIFGDDFIRGTWVQYAWLGLALGTVLMGSMMAYKEPVLKRRLAYSTVSQVSYVVFGLGLLQPEAFAGALMHVVFHSILKVVLFLSAGAIIYKTGLTRVEELKGIGRRLPGTMLCFTVASLGLVGIPPLNGFISKWYLASGALAAEIPVFSYLGPAILLVSAILTAGYLFPVTLNGFFPGEGNPGLAREKESPLMLAPMGILCVLTLGFGLASGGLYDFLNSIAAAVF